MQPPTDASAPVPSAGQPNPVQPTSPVTTTPPVVAGEVAGPVSEKATYQALREQRSELRNQVDRLLDQRRSVAQRLREGENVRGADLEGLEARLRSLDARIANAERQLAEADMAVARAAAVPGAVQRDRDTGSPDAEIAIPIVFTVFVLFPIALAYARRIWRRGATVIAPVPRDVQERLDQMAQAIESIAVETERIGEGQRFLTRVMTEPGRSLGAGPMAPIQAEQKAEQKVAVPEYRP